MDMLKLSTCTLKLHLITVQEWMYLVTFHYWVYAEYELTLTDNQQHQESKNHSLHVFTTRRFSVHKCLYEWKCEKIRQIFIIIAEINFIVQKPKDLLPVELSSWIVFTQMCAVWRPGLFFYAVLLRNCFTNVEYSVYY